MTQLPPQIRKSSITPPLPLSLTPKFQQQKKQEAIDLINKANQEDYEQKLAIYNSQKNLEDKYNAGTITRDEFGLLFPELYTPNKYGGRSATNLTIKYIQYRSSKGLSTTEARRSLPQSGRSYVSYNGRATTPVMPGMKNFLVPTTGPFNNQISNLKLLQQKPALYNKLTAPQEKSPSKIQLFAGQSRQTTFIQPKMAPLQPDILKGPKEFVSQGRTASEKLARQNTALGFIGSFSAGLISAPVGIADLGLNPTRTAKGVIGLGKETIKDPLKTGGKLISEQGSAFSENPAFYAGSFTGTELTFRTAGKLSSPITEPAGRGIGTTASRIREAYDPSFFKKNIEFLPYTPLESLPSLKRLEGKTVPTIQANIGNFPLGGVKGKAYSFFGIRQSAVIVAKKAGVGPARGAIEEFSLFRSTPSPKTGVTRAFVQYAGLGPDLSRATPNFSILPKTPTFLYEEVLVSPTKAPKSANVVQFLRAQERFPGETTIGAQNLARLTKESQLTSRARVLDFPKTKRPASIGAEIELQKQGEFTYYRAKIPASSYLPKSVAESDFFVKTTKINVLQVKTKPGKPVNSANSIVNSSIDDLVGAKKAFTISNNLPRRNVSLVESIRLKPPISVSRVNQSVQHQSSSGGITSSKNYLRSPLISSLVNRKTPSSPSANVSIISSTGNVRTNSYSFPTRLELPNLISNTISSPISPTKISNNSVSRNKSSTSSLYSTSSVTSASSLINSTSFSSGGGLESPKRKDVYSAKSISDLYKPGFYVLYKTRGKVRKLPGEYTRSDALARGETFIGKTLRASFKIRPSGGYAVERRLPRYNLQGYVNKQGFFVQARRTRLGSGGERFEIQQARRAKRNSLLGLTKMAKPKWW